MVVPFDDHMVHRGHGVFDTAHVCDGRCHLLDRHLARFERSMRSAKLNPPAGQSLASMRDTILATIAASGLRDAQVRYYAGAGPGGFALSHDECVDSTFYVTVVAGRAAPDPMKGVSVVTSDVPIKPPRFATVKSVNYLPNAMVVADAHERGADYGVWMTERGFVGEGPSMNLAIVETLPDSSRVFVTPPTADVLAGCTVSRAMELIARAAAAPDGVLAHLGVRDARHEDITVERAKSADEVMLVGSVIWCQPVVSWDGEEVGTGRARGRAGPCALALHEALLADFRDDESELVDVPYA